MADDDALITKAAEALSEHPDCTIIDWDDKSIQFACGEIVFRGTQGSARDFVEARAEHAARAVVEAVRDQIAAEALRGAADACDRDAEDGHCGSASCSENNRIPACWLRARAEALGATESAGEGENGGRGGREAERGRTGDSGEEA